MIDKSDREKLIDLLPEYYRVLYFAYDIVEPNSNILFLEQGYYYYGQSFYYPDIFCDYLPYDQEEISDQEVLEYLKNTNISYILIFFLDFPFSSNTTYFEKYALDSTSYLLEINRSTI